MSYLNPQQSNLRVGIIGGGVGGATIALKLSQLGIKVTLLEKKSSLVNGPPFCHLHAGGNLYREISDEQCLALLKQSIDTARFYHHAIDYRPTIVAVPKRDKGEPTDVVTRLQKLQKEYQRLVDVDKNNQVLGPPEDYFKLFSRDDIETLAKLPTPKKPTPPHEWMINFAKHIDVEQFKFPLILVQEYGISTFRLAASVSLALEKNKNCQVYTSTKVETIKQVNKQQAWLIEAEKEGEQQTLEVDYLINACGFRTGTVDDMLGLKRERMVEFKAAYVSHWPNHNDNSWPEIVFYGERGTSNGMTQLTPYPNGYFQIHGMTPDITLFKDGLVSSKLTSAQPKLPTKYLAKVDKHWDPAVVHERTTKAITKVAEFIPAFANAEVGGNPMYGAQQIPGIDPSLRVADVSFEQNRYARCEIVKASSALLAAHSIWENIAAHKLIEPEHLLPKASTNLFIKDALAEQEIAELANELAINRGYPVALALRNNPNVNN